MSVWSAETLLSRLDEFISPATPAAIDGVAYTLKRDITGVSISAWIGAPIVTLSYITYSVRGLSTLCTLLQIVSPVKLLAPVIAIRSSMLEEVFFRQGLLNLIAAHHQHIVVQTLASGIAFGVAHSFWEIRGGISAVFGAVRSTTLLASRLLWSSSLRGASFFRCVVAHFIINLVLEAWLLYAYIVRAQSRNLPRPVA